uniref:Uncharacterized protein LOC111126909 n=1 Tax=Crassostrea virginica TaxID=6565 RepID=A0A8B8DIL4_CRAVI|nr:uncharacterized protein LOC111126909 [Crassostrea virginica]
MTASLETTPCQEVVNCSLCRTPVFFFCRRCRINLCDSCIPCHLRVKSEFGHDVVDIGSKDEDKSCFCDAHPQYKCSAYCKTCDVVICIFCFSIRHKLHEIIELSSNVELFKRFSREKDRLQSFKNEIEHVLNHTNKLLSSFSSIYPKRKDEVSARGEEWHKQVEKTVKKLHQVLDDFKKENRTALQKQKKDLEEIIGKINETCKKATKLQRSNDIKEMQAFWPVLEEQETIKEIRQHTFPTFCECQIGENYLQTYFGYIEKTPERNVEVTERKLDCDVATDKKIIEVPTVSCVIDSGFPSDEKYNARLYDMAVTDDKKVWMGGQSRELKLFDLQGHLHRTVTITCTGFYICLHKKQVVFSDNLNKAVKRVSDNDTLLTLFKTKDWNPFGITDTSSGDLLLCLRKDDQSKVVRYSSTGTVLQEIQFDSQCQPLYQLAWYITENVNGDVIVTDLKRNVVVAVNRLGVFRYSYGWKKRTSELSTVATNSIGHVFVTDFRGDKIHMLDQYGKFLRYIMPHGEKIDHPRALCMLDDDELIVGECLSGLAKSIKFMEKQ